MEKKLGKIQDVKFGIGGYQDAMIGLFITLGNNGWGVGDKVQYYKMFDELIKERHGKN